jgi:hypothetical protein
MTQWMWVPQHVLSALAVVVLVFLTARLAAQERPSVRIGSIIGLSAATAIGCSVWVGGVALLCASPLLFIAWWRVRHPLQSWSNVLRCGAAAVLIFALTSLPIFAAVRSPPRHISLLSALKFEIFPASSLYDTHRLAGALIHIVLFWIKYLPLCLGIIAVVGWIALARWRAPDLQTRALRWMSVAAALGYALVSQFLCSVIRNNDLGWRAIIVPIMLLSVWTAAWLAEHWPHTDNSVRTADPTIATRQFTPLPARTGRAVAALAILLAIGVGLASTAVELWNLHPRNQVVSEEPIPIQRRFRRYAETGLKLALARGAFATQDVKEQSPMEMQRRFASQCAIWARVREHARPDELVQSNPDGYASVSSYAANLPWAVFSDRRSPYACPEGASVFAYGYDPIEQDQQYVLMQEVFSAEASPQAIRFVHDTLRVKVLLIDREDDAWATTHLEDSGLYRIVYRDADHRIYRAM